MLKDFAKSFLLYGLASGLSKSFLILLVPIYTQVFSTSEYGILDILTGFVALMVIVGMLQLESGVARYYYEEVGIERKRLISTTFWSITGFSILLALLLSLDASFFSEYLFNRADLESIFTACCFLVPLSICFNFLVFLLRYEQKPLIYFLFIIAQVVITILSILYFIYYLDLGLHAVVYGQLVGMILPLLGLLYYFKDQIYLVWDNAIIVKLLRYSIPLIPSVAINWANVYMGRFIMLKYLSMSELGIYSLAVRIATVFSLLEVAFTLTWGPFFWRTYLEKKNQELYKHIFNVLCIVVFFIVISGGLFSKEIISMLSNEKYSDSSEILGLLLLTYGVMIFVQLVGMGPAIAKKTFYNPLLAGLGLLVNVFLLLALIGPLGVKGVAIAAVTGNVVTVCLFWVVSNRLYPIEYSSTFFFICFIVTLAILFASDFLQLNVSFRLLILVITGLLPIGYLVRNVNKIKILFGDS